MSAFTSQKVWKVLIKIQLTKSNPKSTYRLKDQGPCRVGLTLKQIDMKLLFCIFLSLIKHHSFFHYICFELISAFFQWVFFVKLQDERNVIFPKPILELCSEQVLVESFEHGISIGTLIQDLDSTPIDSRKRLAAKGVDMFLKMVFRHNFVHCDLHPGNILVSSNDEKLIILDPGLTASLSNKDMRNFRWEHVAFDFNPSKAWNFNPSKVWIICFCVCLFWNFNPSKAWNFNP